MTINLKPVIFAVIASLTQYSIAGGLVTGGGGNVKNPSPVEESDILKAITNSRSIIEAHLRGVEALYLLKHEIAPVGYKKLFSSKIDIYALLDKVLVKIEASAPCFDLDGSAKDGAIYANSLDTICMSALRFREKLTKDNYESEIAALALHEISHLAETTEEEATDMQMFFLERTKGASSKYIDSWMRGNIENASDLAHQLYQISLDLREGKLDCGEFLNPSSNFGEATINVMDYTSGLSMVRDLDYLFQLYHKFLSISDFLCSLPEIGTPSENEMHSKRYELGFAGQSRVKALDYFRQASGKPADRIETKTALWIDKLSNSDAAFAELLRMSKELGDFSQELRKMLNKNFSETSTDKL
jgi:hypothetical protein